MKAHDFEKYLRRNPGEVRAGLENYRCAVVIPCYRDSAALSACLDSLFETENSFPVAVIVVVNHPENGDAEASVSALDMLQKITAPAGFALFPVYAPDLVNGVGEARKIGFDLFCRSCTAENADDSVMFSLDADCLVSGEYFSSVMELFQSDSCAGGVVIPVKHQRADDPETERAIRCYEEYLLSYERELEAAGSPYAFQTIGSGFAIRVRDYIRCGGMKQKRAGEDFYFLQEMIKSSKLIKYPSVLVYPSPRISTRVPFGTGTAVRDIIGGKMPRGVTKESFGILKTVLDAVNAPGTLVDAEVFLAEIPEKAAEFFRANGFVNSWRKSVVNQKLDSDESRRRAFHLWFDGLQTRRFLHSLSES